MLKEIMEMMKEELQFVPDYENIVEECSEKEPRSYIYSGRYVPNA